MRDDDGYRQRGESGGKYSSALVTRWKDGGGYNNLVLMREDGGLPEASLDDGSTAELSGLKDAHRRRLETSYVVRVCRITHFIQPVQHLDGGLPVDTGIGDADTVLEPRGT